MRFPGFTADASVGRPNSHFRETAGAPPADSAVVPQRRLICQVGPFRGANGESVDFVCSDESYPGGSGFAGIDGDIGAPGRCQPKCGPCRNHTKRCVSVDCEAEMHPC